MIAEAMSEPSAWTQDNTIDKETRPGLIEGLSRGMTLTRRSIFVAFLYYLLVLVSMKLRFSTSANIAGANKSQAGNGPPLRRYKGKLKMLIKFARAVPRDRPM